MFTFQDEYIKHLQLSTSKNRFSTKRHSIVKKSSEQRYFICTISDICRMPHFECFVTKTDKKNFMVSFSFKIFITISPGELRSLHICRVK